MLTIRQAGEADIDLTTEFFMRLWPEHEYGELREEISGIIGKADAAIYLAFLDRRPAGAAQCSLRRDYVEGTVSCIRRLLEDEALRKELTAKGYENVKRFGWDSRTEQYWEVLTQ